MNLLLLFYNIIPFTAIMDNAEKKFKPNSLSEPTDFDNAITYAGYGKFHYEILVVSAICLVCVGFQNGLSAYIFPAAQCELKLSSAQLGFLNVAFLLGGTVSSFLWGILADNIGRKNILATTHLLNALITITCATNGLIESLMVCRFLNGFLIGAPGSIVFSYLAEFQPPKYRSSVICYSGLFFTSSWLLLPVIAWLILPINLFYNHYFTITPWRLFLIILAIPEIIAGLWFLRLPESPKFLVAKGESRQALRVLRKIYSRNTGRNPDDFPVKFLKCNVKIKKCITVKCGKTARVVYDVFGQVKRLFKAPLLFVTLLICTIMFTNMFGTFGLGLWLPELLVRFQHFQDLHPNETATVNQLALLPISKNGVCRPSFEPSVIQSTVAMGVTSLLGNALSGFLANRVQLRTIPLITMLIGGLSASTIYWLRSSLQYLMIASVFQAAMITANMTIGSVTVELFPTSIGAMAVCLMMCVGRIGAIASNIVFGYLMDKHCEIPIFIVAGNVLIGAGLCFMIPKRKYDDVFIDEKHTEISVVSHFNTSL